MALVAAVTDNALDWLLRWLRYGPGVGISKGRKCLRSRKCIVSTNYDTNLRS